MANDKTDLSMIRIVLIIAISVFFLSSCNDEVNHFTAVSRWQVLYSQTEDIDEASSSEEWLDIDIAQSISLPYPEEKTIQYIWVKGSFTALEDYRELYGISIARLSMVDRVYINGDLIGYMDEEEMNSLDSPRNYPIPPGTIGYGVNDLYIRAGVYDEWDVEISEKVFIEDSENFRKKRKQYHLISEIIPISILTLIIGTFFSLLFKSANERWNREYLILAYRLLVVILCYLTFYSPIPLFSIETILSIWNMALPLIFISMILFYQEISRIRFEKINLILIPVLAITSALLFFLTGNGNSGFTVSLLIGLAFVISFAYSAYIFTRIVRNRSRDFKMAVVFLDAFIITANITIVIMFLLFDLTIIDPSLLSVISGFSLTILFSIYFARRDGLGKLKLESLSAKLNDIESKEKSTPKYNISPDLEVRLREITAFIRDNYSAPISREELAETVGVNPNYFSSLFNIYTGKKINEFISDLRLDKASEMLILGSESVIDAAFSSGFESLTTFNRLFKKKYNCTPKEYRTNHKRKK